LQQVPMQVQRCSGGRDAEEKRGRAGAGELQRRGRAGAEVRS